MKKGLRKVIASMLAVTMVLGTGIMATATSNSATGDGSFEGHVEKVSVNVVLPTTAQVGTQFDYIVDPEGLIAATGAALHENKTFEEGKDVFFANELADDDYSASSNVISATNESSISVNVTVKASVAENDNIVMMGNPADFSDTVPQLYLAITDGTNTSAISGNKAASLTVNILGKPNNFQVSTNAANGGYVYAVKRTGLDPWNSACMYLVGDCNEDANWASMAGKDPADLTVTWGYTRADALEISYNTYAVTIPGASGNITSLKFYGPGSTTATALTSGSHYNYNSVTGTLTMANRNVVKADNAGGKLEAVIGGTTYTINIVR